MAGDDPKSSALEDDEDEDPYFDLFDEAEPLSEEELLNLIHSPNPNLMDLSFTQDHLPPFPTLSPSPLLSLEASNEFIGQSFVDDLTLPGDIFNIRSDELIYNNNVVGDIGINDYGNNIGETSTLELSNLVFGENGMSSETGGTLAMPNHPIPAITPITFEGIILCSCCRLIRKLVHANGKEMMRLDIHGGIGFCCHAVLESKRVDGFTQYQTFRLKDLNMEEVRKFIEDYCFERELGGFELFEDTNTDFYQAMHASSININNQTPMSLLPLRYDVPMSLVMPDESLNVPPVPLYVGLRDEPIGLLKRRKTLTPLAAQRERTGKLTLKDLCMYFHLPIEEAARRLSLCPTVMKKICRKGGLRRWPHRKIKSLQKKISSMRKELSTATDVTVKANAEEQIEKLKKKIDEICIDALKNFK